MVDKETGQIGSATMRRGCLVGLATVGHHSWQFTKDLLTEARPLNYFYSYFWIPGREVAEAYNLIFDYAKEGDFEFVFLKEEDTIADPHSWTTMLHKMRYNPDIFAITGVYPRKYGGDPTPFFYRGNGRGAYLDWKWGEFFEVTGIPFGCTIVRVADLEKLDKYVEDIVVENYPKDGVNKTVKAYCQTNTPVIDPSGNKIDLVSQDLYFSEKAQEAGLKLFVDASINCYHLDLKTGIKYIVPRHLHDPNWEEQEGKTAIDLGCGEDWGLVHGVKPVRVDSREEVQPDLRMDLRDLSGIATESYDYVFSSHTLEHFPPDEAKQILREMLRICKQGGEIQLLLPNVLGALQLLEQGHNEPLVWWHLYGRQDADWNRHNTGFTAARIGQLLTELGLRGGVLVDNVLNLAVRAFKPPEPEWAEEWMSLDKSDWSRDRFFNHELEVPEQRKIRVGKLELPIDDSVPDEDVEAYFTPSTRTDEERKGGKQ